MTRFCKTHCGLQSTELLEARKKELENRPSLTSGLKAELDRISQILDKRKS